MIFATFDVKPEEYDTRYKYVGRSWADPSHPFTAAHDLIEHFPDDSGTLEDEMMALGAGAYVRAVITGEGFIHGTIAGDIFNFVLKGEYQRNGKVSLREAPQYNIDDLPAYLVDRFRALEQASFNHWTACPDDLRRKAMDWARIGCLKALKRYEGCENIQNIFAKVKHFLNNGIYDLTANSKSGQLHIAIDPKTGDMDTQYIPNMETGKNAY